MCSACVYHRKNLYVYIHICKYKAENHKFLYKTFIIEPHCQIPHCPVPFRTSVKMGDLVKHNLLDVDNSRLAVCVVANFCPNILNECRSSSRCLYLYCLHLFLSHAMHALSVCASLSSTASPNISHLPAERGGGPGARSPRLPLARHPKTPSILSELSGKLKAAACLHWCHMLRTALLYNSSSRAANRSRDSAIIFATRVNQNIHHIS